jgi:hypothetical protein
MCGPHFKPTGVGRKKGRKRWALKRNSKPEFGHGLRVFVAVLTSVEVLVLVMGSMLSSLMGHLWQG